MSKTHILSCILFSLSLNAFKLTWDYLQAFQIANLIREYTEVLTAAAEEQAKEFSTQPDIRQQQQLQQHNQMQIGNNQMRFHQMQQSKNGPNNLPQNQTHFRQPHGTQLVPPQPS